ncbi:MAG: hypothetical protein KF901_28715 [Myxococcales bacterium]|nr:hypothetical protein [Myxococcales bacterium]
MSFEADDATASTLPPFVEVEMVYETGRQGMEVSPWRALEVWTRNRIYGCDWSMRCIEVIDRETGRPDTESTLLGARLAGGQLQQDDAFEVTHPWPRPGCEAVFEHTQRKGYVTTSTVTRVLLRMRVLTVPHQRIEPTWDDLTTSRRSR